MVSYFFTIVIGAVLFIMIVRLLPKDFNGEEWLRKLLKK